MPNGQCTENDYNENGKVTDSCAGECKDGKKNGSGIATWYDEDGKNISRDYV